MNLVQFVNKYVNQVNVSYDGVPGDRGQCVQLVELYAVQVLGVKLPLLPAAANYWDNPVPGYTKIAYQPGFYPAAGDIVVFSRNLPGSEGYGHIDVCIRNGSVSGFLGLDSNWSPLRVTEVNHDYHYVLGYLRHAAQPQPAPKPKGGVATVIRETYVRTAPNTSAPLGGSKQLLPGSTFQYKSVVTGQDVNENGIHTNQWYLSTEGHYVWKGNCKG